MHRKQSEQDVAEFFDHGADYSWMMTFLPEERKKLDTFLSDWNIQPGDRVLEPGCGAGRLTEVLAAEVGSEGEVYACDFSAKMLELARRRELPGQVHLVQESALTIQRPADWFDQVICCCVFPHFTEPLGILREFARVLKPEGRLWINHFEGSQRLNRFHRDAAPEVAEHLLLGRDSMMELMRQAGFRVEQFTDCEEFYQLQAVLR